MSSLISSNANDAVSLESVAFLERTPLKRLASIDGRLVLLRRVPERNLATLYLALLIARSSGAFLCTAPRRCFPLRNPKVGLVPCDTSRARDSLTLDRGLITRDGNELREQGNYWPIGRQVRDGRHAEPPYWASRPHKPLSNHCLSRWSARLRLLIGSVLLRQYTNKTLTICDFFLSRPADPWNLYYMLL